MLWKISNCSQPGSFIASAHRALYACASSEPLPGAAVIVTTSRTAISPSRYSPFRHPGHSRSASRGGQHAPGAGRVERAAVDDDGAVDDHVRDADRIAVRIAERRL